MITSQYPIGRFVLDLPAGWNAEYLPDLLIATLPTVGGVSSTLMVFPNGEQVGPTAGLDDLPAAIVLAVEPYDGPPAGDAVIIGHPTPAGPVTAVRIVTGEAAIVFSAPAERFEDEWTMVGDHLRTWRSAT